MSSDIIAIATMFDEYTPIVILGHMFNGIKLLLPNFIPTMMPKILNSIVVGITILVIRRIVYRGTLFFGGSFRQAKKNAKNTGKAIDVISASDVFKDK